QHVSIGNDVALALLAYPPVLLGGGLAASLQQLVPANDFRADEAARQVRVDFSRGVLRVRPASDRPRPALVVPRRKKRDQLRQTVRLGGHAAQLTARNAKRLHELGGVLGAEFTQLHFELAGQRQDARQRQLTGQLRD